MARLFAIEGQDVDLTCRLTALKVPLSQAELKLFWRQGGEERPIKTYPVPLARGVGQFTWKAEAPFLDQVRSGSVFARWEAKVLRVTISSPEQEIVVYRDTLEVHFEGREQLDVSTARCVVRMNISSGWNGPSQVRHEPASIDNGVARFSGLPPGQAKVHWINPALLDSWVDDDQHKAEGSKRKAILKGGGYRAVFHFPDPAQLQEKNGVPVHRQYVNLDPAKKIQSDRPDEDHPEYGPELVIKLKADARDRAPQPGDKLFLRATYSENNSKRNADPAPSFMGKGVDPGVTRLVSATAGQGGIAEFRLNLGQAGLDEVRLSAGGTVECEDAQLRVDNWRRIYLRSAVPKSSLDKAPLDLSEEVKKQVKRDLANAGVECVIEEPLVYELDGSHWVFDEDETEARGLPKVPSLIFSQPPDKLPKVIDAARKDRGDSAPRFLVPLCSAIVEATELAFNLTMTTAQTDWIDAGNVTLMRKSLDLDSIIVSYDEELSESSWGPDQTFPKVKSEWWVSASQDGPQREQFDVKDARLRVGGHRAILQDKEETGLSQEKIKKYEEELAEAEEILRLHELGGLRGDIDERFLEIDEDKPFRFKVKLPQDGEQSPGHLVSAQRPIKVRLILTAYRALGGSASGRVFSLATGIKGKTADAISFALLHELGHTLKQAVTAAPPGLDLKDHPDTYGQGSHNDEDQHGHQGPHCRYGLDKAHWQAPSYSIVLRDHGEHGTCIMFGGVGPNTDYAKSEGYCPHCQRFLKATAIPIER